MKYPRKLQEGIFLKRYKRFFADIEFGGQVVTAHVANTGSLKGVNNPGQHCMFSESDNPLRKLKFSLEMIKAPSGAWVGVNTSLPNALVKETLEHVVGHKDSIVGPFSYWAQFDEVKAEHKISAETRLDFMLSRKSDSKKHYIEVKNVTLAEGTVAQFPDAVTERGQKHIRELQALMAEGHTVEILFTIQRHDCTSFTTADAIDPEYGRLLREAHKAGLMVSPFVVDLTPEGANLSEIKLPVKL
jgi:sugar fermentation stimulation protein